VIGPMHPSFVPSNYHFAREISGQAAMAFGDTDDQIAYFYVTGPSFVEASFPIVICAAANPSKRQLGATEGREGTDVVIGSPPRTAVYHDGMWAAGDGPSPRVTGDVVIHWDTTVVHSLTIDSGDVVAAVRVPRESVDLATLKQIATSLPI
jgi:hypothetical protein